MSKSEKQVLKEELLEAATTGIKSMLRSHDGTNLFGRNTEVLPYEKLTEVKVPGIPKETYFEIIVKERKKTNDQT